jgi:hypothetical protein
MYLQDLNSGSRCVEPLTTRISVSHNSSLPTMTITDIPSNEQELTKLMHGKSATERNAFISMLRKDGLAHRLVTDEYIKRWTADSDEARKTRQDSYMSLVNK